MPLNTKKRQKENVKLEQIYQLISLKCTIFLHLYFTMELNMMSVLYDWRDL